MIDRRKGLQPFDVERRSRGSDRRESPRYQTGETPVIISWSEGDEYRTVDARLRDISLGGSAVLTEIAPTGDLVWFRLHGDRTSEWIGASVVGTSKTGILGRGPRLVRIRFRDPCPYNVFKAAIEGFTEEVTIQELKTGRYTKRDWR